MSGARVYLKDIGRQSQLAYSPEARFILRSVRGPKGRHSPIPGGSEQRKSGIVTPSLFISPQNYLLGARGDSMPLELATSGLFGFSVD